MDCRLSMLLRIFLVASLVVGCLHGGDAENDLHAINPQPVDATAGSPLPPGALVRFGSDRFKIGDNGSILGFTPDGKQLLCAGFFHSLIWMDVKTGAIVATQEDTTSFLTSQNVVVAPRTGWVAYPPQDPQTLLLIRDLATQKKLAAIPAPPMPTDPEDAALQTLASDLRYVLSPDEHWLVLCDTTHTVIVDTTTWKTTATFNGERATLPGACFSADSKHLAIAQIKTLPDGKIDRYFRIYETGSFKLLHDSESAGHIQFGPFTTPKAMVTLESSKVICAWDWQTGNEITNVIHRAAYIPAILADARWPAVIAEVSPGRADLPVGLMLLNADTLDQRNTQAIKVPDQAITCVAGAPDLQCVAVGTDQGKVAVFDGNSGARSMVFDAGTGPIPQLQFSPDGKQLAACDQAGVVSIWNLKTGTGVSAPLTGFRGSINHLRVSPDGKTLLGWERGASHNSVLLVWDLQTRQEKQRLEASTREPVFAPDGNLQGVLDRPNDDQLNVRSLHGNSLPLSQHAAFKRTPFAPDIFAVAGRRVAWWEQDNKRIVIADGSVGISLCTIDNVTDLDGALRFIPGEKPQLVAAVDGIIHGWDAESGREKFKLDALKGARPVAVSPRGRWLAVVNDKGQLAVWDLTGEKLVMPFQRTVLTGFDAAICAFAPDEELLVYRIPNEELQAFDLAKGTPGKHWATPKNLSSLEFCPHSPWLVTAHLNGQVAIWDPATGGCQKTLHAGLAGMVTLTFTPDGKIMCTGSMNSTVLLWDFPALVAAPTK